MDPMTFVPLFFSLLSSFVHAPALPPPPPPWMRTMWWPVGKYASTRKGDGHLCRDLWPAAQQGCTATVLKLVGTCRCTKRTFFEALRVAAANDHVQTVDAMLTVRRSGNIDERLLILHDEHNYRLLNTAAHAGNAATVHLLLQAKADVNSLNDRLFDVHTPVGFAARSGFADVTLMLVNARADVNVRSRGQTPLATASMNDYDGVVRILLGAKARVDATGSGEFGLTALCEATRNGCLTTTQLLLTAKASVNKGQFRPMFYAAHRGSLTFVQLLLGAKASVNGDAVAMSPLTAAARHHTSVDIVQLLLQAKALANQAGPGRNMTPLYAAVMARNNAAVRLLLQAKAGADPAEPARNTAPLYVAVVQQNIDAVRMLLQAKADVDQAEPDRGATPLHSAVVCQNTDVMRLLLQAKASVHLAERLGGGTPLYVAVTAQNTGAAQLLIEAKADVNRAMPAAHSAEAAQLLLGAKADVNLPSSETGATPLYVAAVRQNATAVCLMLEAKAVVDQPGKDSRSATALFAAAVNGNAHVASLLLAAKADANRLRADHAAPLHAAVQHGHVSVAQVLVSAKADMDHCAPRCGTALCIAARRPDVGVLQVLLSAKAHVNSGWAGTAPLWDAVHNRRPNAVRLLLAANADARVAKGGQTLLDFATTYAYTDIVQLLVGAGPI